jgi:hypothetical protein
MGQGGDDYVYDDEDRVHLDDSDRSKNGARRLDGYNLQIVPQAGWPGLSAGGGEIQFDPPAMKNVAKWLRDVSSQLERVPVDLELGATTAGFGPASWTQANNLKTASDMVANTVRDYSTRAIANLAAAASAIEASASGLDAADQDSTAGVTNTGNNLG